MEPGEQCHKGGLVNIKEQLEDAQNRQQEVVAQIITLEQLRHFLLQEALKTEGEISILRKLMSDGEDK